MYQGALNQEWQTLQHQHEEYEKSALHIKLLGFVIYTIWWIWSADLILGCSFILLLWIQESMWRTWQARLATRILQIEALLQQIPPADQQACQLHTQWLAKRFRGFALLAEYIKNLIRPGIAFPYALMLSIILIRYFILLST